MNGINTRAQAIGVAPVLHIKLSIQVQNIIYNNLTVNIRVVLVTSQDRFPRQYTLLLPIFCIDAMSTKKSEITK
jgi:hypothetical protein